MKVPVHIAMMLCLAGSSAAASALECGQAVTQADMNACAAQELNQADTELNRTYLAYRAKLHAARQNQIRDVQLAWIKYRDLACRFEGANVVGGSAAGMALQTCLTEKTRQRTSELRTLAGCQEGDLSCPR